MEQQPQHAFERTKSEQKQNQVTSYSNMATHPIVRLSPQTMQ